MPPFRPNAVQRNHVRLGFVVVRGRGGDRAARRLRRLAPLAIRGPPDGDHDYMHEAVRAPSRIGISPRRHTVAGGPVLLPDPMPYREVAREQRTEHEEPPDPLALPVVLEQAPNSPYGSSSESGLDGSIRTTSSSSLSSSISSESFGFVPIGDSSDEEM